MADHLPETLDGKKSHNDSLTLFMCGDVMTGRGIDQILPHPGDPTIHESYMKSARGYVQIAERVNGPIDSPVDFAYVWGAARQELRRMHPDVRIINLETSVTRSEDYWKGKGINYRMNPDNLSILTVAGIDICALANNHVLDWGYAGLHETLESIQSIGVKTAGAGRNIFRAQRPAFIEIPGKGRVVLFAFGLKSSGIPSDWGAAENRAGINLLRDFSTETLLEIQSQITNVKRAGDVVVASIHWGSNWGYRIPPEQRDFAHRLIEEAGVDVIHGHSSHHVKAIEVYQDKLILYGCGDFINDYEGIGGHERFRGDLALMYFATINPSTGQLKGLKMTPTHMRKFKIRRASKNDTRWLQERLNNEGIAYRNQTRITADEHLSLQWVR